MKWPESAITDDALSARAVGYVDELGYLWCVPCMVWVSSRSQSPPLGWEPIPDGAVYAGETHSDEPCDFCHSPLTPHR
jgi:hypothetical protein